MCTKWDVNIKKSPVENDIKIIKIIYYLVNNHVKNTSYSQAQLSYLVSKADCKQTQN